MERVLKYEGPLWGELRFKLNKKEIKEIYDEMLKDVNDRFIDGDAKSLQEAVDQTNEAWVNNEFGLYLFIEDYPKMVTFDFRDCRMKGFGYYELVG